MQTRAHTAVTITPQRVLSLPQNLKPPCNTTNDLVMTMTANMTKHELAVWLQHPIGSCHTCTVIRASDNLIRLLSTLWSLY